MGKLASKWQSRTMLKQRILTALTLASLVLWALFGLSDDYLMVLFAVVIMAGTYEWLKLANIQNLVFKLLFFLAQAFLISFVWYLVESKQELVVMILASAVLAWLLIMFWLALYEKGIVKIQLHQISRVLLGLILLPVCLLAIGFILQGFQNDRLTILLMFILIWGADVAAYFSGKAFGKHKLAPTISPGKSWEGVFGALLGTILISAVAAWLMNYSIQMLPGFVVFCLLVVVLSVVGDLFESLLKRQVGIKDSGNILPGHGGVLDRIDSLIAASPLFALGMYLLGGA